MTHDFKTMSDDYLEGSAKALLGLPEHMLRASLLKYMKRVRDVTREEANQVIDELQVKLEQLQLTELKGSGGT